MYPFRTYTTQSGLISNTINDLFQDSRGYLWVATFDGLSVFDGSSFKSYTSLDGLAHHLPWCVTESKRLPGTLFIGTNGGGISRFKDERFSTVRLGSGHEENEVNDIVEGFDGSLWCLTTSGVVVVMDTIPIRLSLHAPYASRSLALSNDSVVWVGENKTLYRFSPSRRMLSRHTVPLRGTAVINSLYADRQGNVWVLGSDSSVSLYNDTSLLLRRRISEGMPGQMLIDRQENVWITVSHNGVLRLPRSRLAHGRFDRITVGNGLHSNDITVLLLDREENVWFGSHDKGIAVLTEQSVLRFVDPKPTGVGLEFVGGNRAWAVSESAVMEYWNDSASWHTAVHPVAPSGTTIRSMAYGRTDLLWFVLSDNSIHAYRIKNGSSSRASHLKLQTILRAGVDFPKAWPFLCFVDRSGLLWYTIEPRGVGIIDVRHTPRFEKQLSYPDEIPVAAVRVMYQDAPGNMWFGSFAEGLAMLPRGDWRKERMKKFTTADGLPDNGVRSMAEDDYGRLWIGTRYGGVAIYDGHRFQNLTARDGLLSNAIWSLSRGTGGTMWLGTSLGLMYIASDANHQTGWNPELVGNDTRLVRVDSIGRVWSIAGGLLSIYEPSKHEVNAVPPSIHLVQVTINARPVPLQTHLELAHDQNNIVLQYVGVSFRGGVRYRHRLKGVEQDWSVPSPQREVSYAALSPGSYTFEVLAVNNDGVESAMPASASFTILPPFWRRPWFLVVAGLLFAGAFGGVVRYVSTQKLRQRVQELEKERAVQMEREHTRDRIARDLHDDVASTLGSVVIYSESLKRRLPQHGEASELAGRISALSQEAQDAIGDIVWSTAPQHDTLEELLTRMKDITASVCTARNIMYTIAVDSDIPAVRLRDDVRRNLFLIFKESMNNIIKHSGASTVQLQAEYRDAVLHLVIRDNGKGFDTTAESQRNHGLRNMHKRAEQVGGQFSITSKMGEGTLVEVFCRIPRSG
ncbi:MAG TPA: two-component regulator propeller domain-containing protein [Bacteroidota bacterium]|nr:two-component regulator propeller domain-containing protein [Bacteroidota bacterium]